FSAECLESCFTDLPENEADFIKYDKEEWKFSLTCKNTGDGLTAIEHTSSAGTRRYTKLWCDYTRGWKDKDDDKGNVIGEPGVQFNATCTN
ncbi:hypothetical protein PFISCL1PPCAC_28453, partial [Pristionchus fissidentatus]